MVYMDAPRPTSAIVRTPAGRSEDDRSSPTNAPEHAAYKIRKQSSSSALLGIKLNDPRARDLLENDMTGEIPLATVVVAVADDTVVAARAGEKAGAKITMAARIVALMMRTDPLLRRNFDAHRRGAGLYINDGNNHENGFETCLA